jgi:hypothetical protein
MEYGVFYKAIAGLLRGYWGSFGPAGVKINKFKRLRYADKRK